MKKILISLLTIVAVAGVAIGATNAFFSDTETSTDNQFVAGALDLKIDNHSFATDCTVPDSQSCTGELAESPTTSWELNDLSEQKFFNFHDLKPGDEGEDTISVHVDNDAWLCMDWHTTDTLENDYLQPEINDGDTTEEAGELQNFINFVWWVDDGDNVLETDEADSAFFSGTLDEMSNMSVALADSSQDSLNGGLPIPGNTNQDEGTFYIGKAWCFGDLSLAPAEEGDTGPLDRGSGVLCNGQPVDNTAQTDAVLGDLSFRAVQARHNESFLCSGPEDNNGTHRLVLENKNPDTWENLDDKISGVLTWAGDGPTFDFSNTFEAQGLLPSTEYSLIYAPDPWPQGIGNDQSDGTGTLNTVLGQGTSDASGNLEIKNNVDLGYDMPHPNDANFDNGAKIWLVLSADHDGKQMIAWHPDQYLFETELIHYDDTNVN